MNNKVHITLGRRLNDDDRSQLLIDIEGEVYGEHAGGSGGTIVVPALSTGAEIVAAAKAAVLAKCERAGVAITSDDIIIWRGPQ